nr:hypothetical protein [Pedobacter sp. ASV2]
MIWYNLNGRKFVWRQDGFSQYEIIIVEALLQRTKAETIALFFDSFIAKYPSWQSIAIAPLQKIELDLRPIGLYKQRAKRIKNMALEIIGRNEILPPTREDLDKIPMFGQYIANAIELQIFNRNKPLLDVNMARLLERYFGPRTLSDIRYDPYLQDLAHRVVNHKNAKMINWGILDFAALVCKSRKPRCITCFLSNDCEYYNLFINK